MQIENCVKYCQESWAEGGAALEGLKELIRVPNLSPDYDEEYFTNGLVQKAVDVTKKWIEAQELKGIHITVYDTPNVEPLLFVEIDATPGATGTILTYGHLDKMPHLDAEGWSEGLGAIKPAVRGPKLYGRGSNDDGYNPFCVITAIKYLQLNNLPHSRIVMLLETGEESSGEEIERYLHKLRPEIGDVDVILVLDAEAQDYKTLWCCTSLRGVAIGTLDVQHMKVPVHSGMATGVVPSTFRIARMLLSRIENEQTGEILIPGANLEIPETRIEQSKAIAQQLGEQCVATVAPLPGAKLLHDEIYECLLGKAWRPGLAITGADGIPSIANGSNVIRTRTALKLSLRLPPGIDAETINNRMKEILEKDPPYGAKVVYTPGGNGNGWSAKDFKPKVNEALKASTKEVFNQEPLYYGEGGSIPLCNVLQQLWPDCDLIVTGCAGVDSNPHGYDESLDLPYTASFTAMLSDFVTRVAH